MRDHNNQPPVEQAGAEPEEMVGATGPAPTIDPPVLLTAVTVKRIRGALQLARNILREHGPTLEAGGVFDPGDLADGYEELRQHVIAEQEGTRRLVTMIRSLASCELTPSERGDFEGVAHG